MFIVPPYCRRPSEWPSDAPRGPLPRSAPLGQYSGPWHGRAFRWAAAGLREPIAICEGKILDGRNRHKACVELGIEPATKVVSDNPWTYARSENFHRRDLTQSRRAQIGVRLDKGEGRWQELQEKIAAEANAKRSETQKGVPKAEIKERGSQSRPSTLLNPTRKERAKAHGVSETALQRAQTLENRRPDLADKVIAGTLHPEKAFKEAGLKDGKKDQPTNQERDGARHRVYLWDSAPNRPGCPSQRWRFI